MTLAYDQKRGLVIGTANAEGGDDAYGRLVRVWDFSGELLVERDLNNAGKQMLSFALFFIAVALNSIFWLQTLVERDINNAGKQMGFPLH